MSGVTISSMYMASDKVIAEHNQAELSKLEVRVGPKAHHSSFDDDQLM